MAVMGMAVMHVSGMSMRVGGRRRVVWTPGVSIMIVTRIVPAVIIVGHVAPVDMDGPSSIGASVVVLARRAADVRMQLGRNFSLSGGCGERCIPLLRRSGFSGLCRVPGHVANRPRIASITSR